MKWQLIPFLLLSTIAVLAQELSHQEILPLSFYKIDTSFSYSQEQDNWLPDRMTLNYKTGYDQTDLKIIWGFQADSSIYHKKKATKFLNPDEQTTVHVHYAWEDSLEVWFPESRYTREKFFGSNETNSSLSEKYNKTTNIWVKNNVYVRTYNFDNTERFEKRVSFDTNGEKIVNGQKYTFRINEFGETQEEIVEKYDQLLEIWVNDRWIIHEDLFDSSIKKTRFWNKEKQIWEEESKRQTTHYFKNDEFQIVLPDKCRSPREIKQKKVEEKDSSGIWLPLELRNFSHDKTPKGYQKKEITLEWNEELNDWHPTKRSINFYDKIGNRMGHSQDEWHEKDWRPLNKNTVEPDGDYLKSKSQRFDKKTGKWSKLRKYRYKPCYPVRQKGGV